MTAPRPALNLDVQVLAWASVTPRQDGDGVPWCSTQRCIHFEVTACAINRRAVNGDSMCYPGVRALAHANERLLDRRTSTAASKPPPRQTPDKP